MITIEVWSDVNCPFCYIGKRHLEKSLEGRDDEVEVIWRSFELDPMAKPEKGLSNNEMLAKKYGKDLAWAQQMNQNLTNMAQESGLAFQMDKVVPANSFNAHRLIHLALSHGLQDQMKERLLKAKFCEGRDIGDSETLVSLGLELNLPEAEIRSTLSSHQFESEVRREEEMALELGIRGVPFFVFNKKLALSGAQPVEMFQQALNQSV